MAVVLTVTNQHKRPEPNEFQCGAYRMHILEEAQAIAKRIPGHNVV